MAMAIVSPYSGAGWAAYRVGAMFKPIEAGNIIPNVKLSRLAPDGTTVVSFNTKEELGSGLCALFTMQKAFNDVCSKEHLPGLVKAVEAFKNLDIKMFCLAFNTKEEMFGWAQKHDPDHQISMIPDYGGDFIFLTGLGMDQSKKQLGFVAQRSAIFLYNGKVLDVQIEEDSGKCTPKSSAEGLLERIPAILKANDLPLPSTNVDTDSDAEDEAIPELEEAMDDGENLLSPPESPVISWDRYRELLGTMRSGAFFNSLS